MRPGALELSKEAPAAAPRPPARLARVARRLYAERRKRDEILDFSLLREGAWDMLLDLYASMAEGRPVCVTSACAASCAPSTTALRLVERLEKAGLVRRVKVAWDRRIRYLELTGRAEAMMTRYLESISAPRARWESSSLS